MKLSEISKIVPVKIVRDGAFTTLGMISSSKKGRLVYLGNKKFLKELRSVEGISCVITTPDLVLDVDESFGLAMINTPDEAFFSLHNFLVNNTKFYRSDFNTEISADSNIHCGASISPKNVRIGRNCLIENGVFILDHTVIGDGVVLRTGTIIGSEGFEFRRVNGKMLGIAHDGGVVIGNNVELQSNTIVCRGIYGENTEIGEGTKTDNLVHIAHCSKIGRNCLIAAHSMIAGSARIGDNVWIGPGSNISSGVRIGNNVRVTIGSTVLRDVSEGETVTGYFAQEHKLFLRNYLRIFKQKVV